MWFLKFIRNSMPKFFTVGKYMKPTFLIKDLMNQLSKALRIIPDA